MYRFALFNMVILFIGVQFSYSQHQRTGVYNRITEKFDTIVTASIRDVQYVPPESLALADQFQAMDPSRWFLQTSPYFKNHDTIAVTGLVVIPCAADPPYNGITCTAQGWTMLIHDTGTTSNEWTGILVRVASTDTAIAESAGFKIPARGDVISFVATVDEVPAQSMNSMTEIVPQFGYDTLLHQIKYPVTILSHDHVIPPPTIVTIDSFYTGHYPMGSVRYSSGEKYECGLVMMASSPGNRLIVTHYINIVRGIFGFADKDGNELSDYDASHYFTYGHGNPPIPGDPSFHLPPVGAEIDSMKGAMFVVSGAENPRGYRFGPLFPADLKVGTPSTASLLFSPGWNLMSIPLSISDNLVPDLFPDATSWAFYYENGYKNTKTLASGVGYWLEFDSVRNRVLNGWQISSMTIPVSPGWNMVGSVSYPVPVTSIASTPGGIVTGQFYGYNGVYFVTDTMYPGCAYWVRVTQPGSLVLDTNASSLSSGRIRILLTSGLPPPLPGECQARPPVPENFGLEQAYPNPFNPVTTIRYQLPVSGNVSLKVYNLLGQTVAILQNGVFQAGYQQVEWNAVNFPGGTYFYRLDAVSIADPLVVFTAVKKIILVK